MAEETKVQETEEKAKPEKKKKKDPSEEASRLFVLPLQPKEESFSRKETQTL